MRSSLKWIGLTAAAAVLTTGCVARAPQRSPGHGAGTPGPAAISSTTGDADACAAALGNTPGPTGGGGFLPGHRAATGSTVGGATDAAGTPGPGANGTTARPSPGTAGMTGNGPTTATPGGSPLTMTAPGTGTGAAGGATGGAGGAGATRGGTAAGGAAEATANGILIGNVALVALPDHDNMGLSPQGPGAPTPGARIGPSVLPGPGGAGTTTTPPATAGGTTVTPGGTTPPVARGGVGPGRTGMVRDPYGGATGGASGSPGTDVTGGPAGAGLAGGTTAGTAPGATTTGPAATGTNVGRGATPTALDRIRSSCTRVAQIRVVTDDRDRTRLAEIAASIRQGQPITNWMTEISAISSRAATTVDGPPGTGGTGTGTPGAGGTGTPGAGGAGNAPPGSIGPGTTPPANR